MPDHERGPGQRRPQSPQPRPPADEFRRLQDEWNRRLKEADPALLTPTEEEQGVHHGAADAEDAVQDWLDSTDRQIAAKLQEESPDNIYVGSPVSFSQLVTYVRQLLSEHIGQTRIFVHRSCVTADDCVLVRTPEKKYHISTRCCSDYSFERLQAEFHNEATDVQYKED